MKTTKMKTIIFFLNSVFMFYSLTLILSLTSCEKDNDGPKWYCNGSSCKEYTYAEGDYYTKAACESDCSNNSGGGGSSNCNYTTYSGTGCNPGYVAISSTICCPSTNPYYGNSTGKCYTSCEYARDNGNSSIIKGIGTSGGGGGGGGGGSPCDWNSAVQHISVTGEWGKNCNSSTSLNIGAKNTASFKIEVKLCVQRKDGTYSAYKYTVNPGQTVYGHACDASGNYIIKAISYADYVAGGYCSSGGCN